MIASALKRLLDKHIPFRKKSKCRRAACSKRRPILTRETICLHDLRAFPCNRSSWSTAKTLRFVQYACRMTASKISTFDGIKPYYQQAICLQMWCWKDCTSQNYRTLFSFRLSWLCTTKKLFETMNRQVVYDWKRLQNLKKIKLWELETSESGAKLWREEQSPRVRKERKPSLRGKWEPPFGELWWVAAASSIATVIRACRSHERRRRSLLLLAEEDPAWSLMATTGFCEKATRDTVTLECKRLVVVVVLVCVEGSRSMGKFSHFDKISWFSQIVIKYPDKYPDNISNQEIRSVQPNRPMNTGWRQQTMNMTPWWQNDWFCSQPRALSVDPMKMWQVRRTLGWTTHDCRQFSSDTQKKNEEGPSSLDWKQLSGCTWSSGSLMFSWVSKCVRPLHTMLGFSSGYSDTNSLVVKSANSFTFTPRERSLHIPREFQIPTWSITREVESTPTERAAYFQEYAVPLVTRDAFQLTRSYIEHFQLWILR